LALIYVDKKTLSAQKSLGNLNSAPAPQFFNFLRIAGFFMKKCDLRPAAGMVLGRSRPHSQVPEK